MEWKWSARRGIRRHFLNETLKISGPSSAYSPTGAQACILRRTVREFQLHTEIRIAHASLPKRSIDTLGAIARFRRQRRASRGWLVGDRGVSSATITYLEKNSLVREVAFISEPTLILTEVGKRFLAEHVSV